MNFPLARQYFYREIHQAEKNINLAKAALYIAQEEYPDLAPEEYLNALDTMAEEIEERLPRESYPLRIIQCINNYLYDDLGFTGNSDDYYDPRNSYLNQVIERKTGIPITLSLVYLEIAQRIDFPMVGIGMPGHFLIRPDFQDVGIYVDAFNGGEILFEQDCEQRLSQIYQQSVMISPNLLEPVTPRRFLSRMLMNLKMIYLNRGEWQKALASIERILLLFPGTPTELRDRGLLYYQIGELATACQDLESYLMQVPNAEDSSFIRQLVAQIRENL